MLRLVQRLALKLPVGEMLTNSMCTRHDSHICVHVTGVIVSFFSTSMCSYFLRFRFFIEHWKRLTCGELWTDFTVFIEHNIYDYCTNMPRNLGIVWWLYVETLVITLYSSESSLIEVNFKITFTTQFYSLVCYSAKCMINWEYIVNGSHFVFSLLKVLL